MAAECSASIIKVAAATTEPESTTAYARPSSRTDAFGIRRRQASFFAVDLAHPLRWHDGVYRRGLSGASGCFVFEAVGEVEDSTLVVLTARRGRGCLRIWPTQWPSRGRLRS